MNLPSPDQRDPQFAAFQQGPEEELFNLRSALATIVDAWPLAAGLFLAGVAMGLYKGWVTPPLYASSALVQIESNTSGFAVGPETFGGFSPYTPPESASTQIEILKSRSILGTAAEQLGLTTSALPRYSGPIGAARARRYDGEGVASAPWYSPFSRKYAWGGERIEIGSFKLDGALLGTALTLVAGENGSYALRDQEELPLGEGTVGTESNLSTPNGSIKLLISRLDARPGTEFILQQLQTKEAAEMLLGSMEVMELGAKGYFAGTGILKITVNAGSPKDASDSANAIASTYLRQNVERLSAGAERKLEFLTSQLPRLQQELETAEQALLEQRSKSGPYQLSEGAKSILETLTALERQIAELELERTELSQTFTAEHPSMAAINRKLEQMQAERARINATIAALPDAESRQLQLMRNSKVASELYVSLLNKSQELKVAKAGTIGNVRIIDLAVPENLPVQPRRARLLLTWSALGLIAGLGAVFLRQHLNVTIEWAEDAEKAIGIPVYATVPFSPKQSQLDLTAERAHRRGRNLLAETEPHDVAVESLRSLRASLHFAMLDAKRNLVVITGSTPNVGKSFIAANLARLVADAGKKVLLIDADLRKGRMHGMLGLPRAPGLSEAIAGQASGNEVRHQVGETPFWAVTTGKLPPNPAELLGSDRFIELVESACKDFDLVIVDTPPILNLADAVLVAKSAGALFVTIRGGVSTVPDVLDCVQRFAKNGIKVDGLIFNGLKPTLGSYLHPQYYHYRYRYSRYGGKAGTKSKE